MYCFFFFKQKTAYELRISDWSSDVCSSDLKADRGEEADEAFQQEENNPRHRAISAARPLPGQLNLGVAVRPRQLARRRAICAESRRPPGGAENRRMKKTLLSLLRRPRHAA